MERHVCKMCRRIETTNDLCCLCAEKGYPSKISAVYPEGSLKQRIATHAFNQLAQHFDKDPAAGAALAAELGVPERYLYEALEELYTEN